MSITAWQASSWSRATITPFPAARPLAFTTRAGKSALENQRDEINLGNVQQESFLCLPAAATDAQIYTEQMLILSIKCFFCAPFNICSARCCWGMGLRSVWMKAVRIWQLLFCPRCFTRPEKLLSLSARHFFPLLPSPLLIKVTNLFMPDRSVRLRSSERRSLHLRSLTHETIWGRKLPSSFTVSLFMRFTALKTKLRSHKQSFTVNRKPHLQSQLLLQLSWTKTSFQQSKTRTVTLMKCMPHISFYSTDVRM